MNETKAAELADAAEAYLALNGHEWQGLELIDARARLELAVASVRKELADLEADAVFFLGIE